jgi:hypothetical protein
MHGAHHNCDSVERTVLLAGGLRIRCGWRRLLAGGRQKYERHDQIQYCGITERRFCDRINSRHHKLDRIRPETLTVWLGTIAYSVRFRRRHLEIAEHCLVAYQPTAPNDTKHYYTTEPVCLISQWHLAQAGHA